MTNDERSALNEGLEALLLCPARVEGW